MRGKSAGWTTREDMPIEGFRRRAQTAKKKAATFGNGIRELFSGLVTLTGEQRRVAPRLRDGEHPMLARVLRLVDKTPGLFESLADEDEGMDPNNFETPLLRDGIESKSSRC